MPTGGSSDLISSDQYAFQTNGVVITKWVILATNVANVINYGRLPKKISGKRSGLLPKKIDP